jgi:hypothetical protein
VAQPLDAQGLALREHRQRTRRRDADIVAVIDRAASDQINGKGGADAGNILPGLRIDPHHGKQFAGREINLPLGGRIGGEAPLTGGVSTGCGRLASSRGGKESGEVLAQGGLVSAGGKTASEGRHCEKAAQNRLDFFLHFYPLAGSFAANLDQRCTGPKRF